MPGQGGEAQPRELFRSSASCAPPQPFQIYFHPCFHLHHAHFPQWLAPIQCYIYPFFCGTCAAADVQNAVVPGTWWSFFCWLQFLGHCVPCCGSCLQVRYIFMSRRALALQQGVEEEPVGECPNSFCEGLACTSCYVGQELAHLEAAKGGASGIDKLSAV